LAFAPASNLLAWGGLDRVIHLGDARSGGDRSEGTEPLGSRTLLALSPDGTRLFSLGAGTDLRVWDVTSGRRVLELEDGPILRAFALSPDGKWLAASRAPGEQGEDDRATLGLWRADTGRRQAPFDGQRAPITALAFAPDSALLAAGGFQSTDVWLWKVPSGEPSLILTDAVDDCSVEALAFQPGAGITLAVAGIDWLAASGVDGRGGVWDVPARRGAGTLAGGALAVAWHPAGRQLATASLVQSVRIWDIASQRILLDLLGHQEPITCLAYSPNGHWLASGGD